VKGLMEIKEVKRNLAFYGFFKLESSALIFITY